jgi:hypothetical protein
MGRILEVKDRPIFKDENIVSHSQCRVQFKRVCEAVLHHIGGLLNTTVDH